MCIRDRCIEVFLPYIFLLILVEVLKDALQPNFQQVEDGRLRALVQDLPAVLLILERGRECLVLSIPSAFPSKTMVSIALAPEVPLLLLMLECLTDCLKDTAVGNQTRQKTVTLRIYSVHSLLSVSLSLGI